MLRGEFDQVLQALLAGLIGLRALLIDHTFRADLMIQAFAINMVLFVLAILAFFAFLRSSRQAGTLLAGGE